MTPEGNLRAQILLGAPSPNRNSQDAQVRVELQVFRSLLTRQQISERVYVMDCQLLQRSAQPIHGIYIGQYRIRLLKRLRYSRVPAYILRELNRGLPNCRYDGYWASTEIASSFISP
ncbi:hypothetical protein T265_03883 [Opisthorchis viverrini]|uniref:Uncharacterized protein n=1 Tax=Opisthorchis viverrini TaxID=6198 RepID=A0A074ZUI6_OPIVI|nr:hypothetical protein T265_03883 [Opisthorchis viverrini]KER29507.1 hypothetical protein T265_03883 [Opisthorchis viverrini]